VKIGIYDPYLDDLGGGEKYMMSIAHCLSTNHQVTVFWDEKSDLEVLQQRFSIDLSKITVSPNIFTKQIALIDRLIKSKEFDAMLILSDGSIPILWTKKLFIHIQQPLQNVKTTSLLTKFKISRINNFFCNSKFTKSFIDKKYYTKSKIVYPPITLHPKNIKKENIILHVGRFRVKNVGIEDYKKQGVMIKTFNEMVKEGFKNWKFILAVSVLDENIDQFEELKKTAEGFPVTFFVNKKNDELWDLYNKAKIYWHASGFGEDLDNHPEFAEHFGISTVEAMGAGAVPIVINAGGQKEIVEDRKNGLLWNTLEELQKRTRELSENNKLLLELSASAKVRAQEFSGDRFCTEILQLLRT